MYPHDILIKNHRNILKTIGISTSHLEDFPFQTISPSSTMAWHRHFRGVFGSDRTSPGTAPNTAPPNTAGVEGVEDLRYV